MKRNLKREKARKLRRAKKCKVMPYLSLLKQADAVFSKWIRTRDNWTCIVCGTKENIQNGHLIPRGNKAVRYDEKNCDGLCGYDNWRDRFWHHYYEIAWLKRYGVDEMMKLAERASVKVHKIPREELEYIIKRYALR